MRLLLSALLFAAPAAHAQVAAQATVDTPVLVRSIERGEPLALSDFAIKPVSSATARGAILPAEAEGKEASRRLMAGTVVRQGDLIRAQLVRRGDTVILAVRTGALSITTSGKALSGGGAGDVVRIANLETGRALSAVVEDKGRVRVAAGWEGQ